MPCCVLFVYKREEKIITTCNRESYEIVFVLQIFNEPNYNHENN